MHGSLTLYLCCVKAILEPVYLGMKYLRLITAEMEIPEDCILFALIGAGRTQKVDIHEECILLVPIVVEGLLSRRKYTRNVFCLPL